MKAAVLHAIGDLRVEDVEIPSIGDGEVLIRVKAVGICGSDVPRVNEFGAHKMPIIIGHEFAGEVAAVGKDVRNCKPGDRVTAAPMMPCYTCWWCRAGDYSLCDDYSYIGSRCDGAFAEFVKIDARNVLVLPDGVSYMQGALLDPAANAAHSLLRQPLRGGEVVAVYGAGPIGLLTVQMASVLGAGLVIAIDVVPEKLELARSLGVDHVILASAQDPVQAIRDLTGGRMADRVIESSGSPRAQQQGIMSLGKRGCMVVLGISHAGLSMDADMVDAIMRQELTVTGSWNSFSAPFPGHEWLWPLELFRRGRLRDDGIVTHYVPLDEAPAIFSKIKSGELTYCKIMFSV